MVVLMDAAGWCMNRRLVLCFLIAFVIGGCAASAPFKEAELESIIGDVERKAYLVSQFEAEFVKRRDAAVFAKEMSVDGHLIFQRPGKFWLSLKGDINVDILSNGEVIKIVHDQRDEETYHVRGDRDLSRFADPLMLLIEGVASGWLRSLKIVNNVRQDGLMMVEIDPGHENHFERIRRVFIWFSDLGDIRRVRIVFKNGNVDDTVFTSWALLDEDGPEIRRLNEKLNRLAATMRLGSPDEQCPETLPLAQSVPSPESPLLEEKTSGSEPGEQ
jgi:outer membrane lipoprotein-sorting protein